MDLANLALPACLAGEEDSHIYHDHQALCGKQQETTLLRALYRHSPGQDFSTQIRLVELNEFDCLQGEKKNTKQTPHPQKALSNTHSTMPQLKRELPPAEILHRLLHAPGRGKENGTERCFAEVLHTGYLQYKAHLRAKIQQGRSHTAAPPLCAINTYPMTTNAWILRNETKAASVCGREDSLHSSNPALTEA